MHQAVSCEEMRIAIAATDVFLFRTHGTPQAGTARAVLTSADPSHPLEYENRQQEMAAPCP